MISSNLQSQLFSRIATWDILTANNLVWGHRCPMRIAQLKIEVWAHCVYVHLPKDPVSKVSPQGISRFLSMWDYLDCMMARTLDKANNIQARLINTNIWEVEGSQRQFYHVHFSPFGARCHCMLFLCLANRIKKECPYFYELMKQCQFFSGQVVCHHIAAALSYQGFGSLAEYLEAVRRKPIVA